MNGHRFDNFVVYMRKTKEKANLAKDYIYQCKLLVFLRLILRGCLIMAKVI